MADTKEVVIKVTETLASYFWAWVRSLVFGVFCFALGVFCGIGISYKVVKEERKPIDIKPLEMQIEKLSEENRELKNKLADKPTVWFNEPRDGEVVKRH